ncbi:hypothetical protein [Tsukamurella sp. 1534]|uniref:hypothetical protein n=1 Tax=Tsukamurella sp. 1534 TaxID=1151061 RepID=UPI0002E5EE53|nr:hypothetical protein [Tsukamurella sp. 1534]
MTKQFVRTLVSAALGLTVLSGAACSNDTGGTPAPETASITASNPASVQTGTVETHAPEAPATKHTPAQRPTTKPRQPEPGPTTPAQEARRCTDRINYAGDPRSNAEINSIGERTGKCPPPIEKETAKCTDQINYAGDPRSNAEINSIGERTGKCPPPKKAPSSN